MVHVENDECLLIGLGCVDFRVSNAWDPGKKRGMSIIDMVVNGTWRITMVKSMTCFSRPRSTWSKSLDMVIKM